MKIAVLPIILALFLMTLTGAALAASHGADDSPPPRGNRP